LIDVIGIKSATV